MQTDPTSRPAPQLGHPQPHLSLCAETQQPTRQGEKLLGALLCSPARNHSCCPALGLHIFETHPSPQFNIFVSPVRILLSLPSQGNIQIVLQLDLQQIQNMGIGLGWHHSLF